MGKQLYEKFHKHTNALKKIANEDNYTYRPIFRFLQTAITKRKSSILDLGCGAGQTTFFLAQKKHNVTGIDISKKAIDSCIKTKESLRINNVNFKQGDVLRKKFDRKFDLIVICELIEHLKNDKQFLLHLKKIIKKDGKVFISTPSITAPLYRMRLLKGFDKKVGHLRRYSKEGLIKLLGETGYKVIRIEEHEGIIRNFLYTFALGTIPLKIIHRVSYLRNLIEVIDSLSVKLFGSSDYLVLAQKK